LDDLVLQTTYSAKRKHNQALSSAIISPHESIIRHFYLGIGFQPSRGKGE
jgi:hypothetical protein